MAEPKTRPTKESVAAFLAAIADNERRKDCKAVAKLMQEATGARPVMWGTSIVGFGTYRQRYAGGREDDWPVIAFSPRKGDLTLYLVPGFGQYSGILHRLGRHKAAKCCLYLRKLADVDLDVLRELIGESVKAMQELRVDR